MKTKTARGTVVRASLVCAEVLRGYRCNLSCAATAPPAFAQAIIASINGDPIQTSISAKRMKRCASRTNRRRVKPPLKAFTDRLKPRKRISLVSIRDSDISQQIVKTAQAMKMAPRPW